MSSSFRSALAIAGVLCCSSAMAQPPADLSWQPVITSGSVSGALALRHADDGSGRLFVAEQSTGNIKIIGGGVVSATPFLTINASTPGGFTGGSERGLLGLAFHPQFAINRKLYVNYTDGSGHTRVVEYQASQGNPNIVDLGSRRQLMLINQPSWNHNGGNILFGPDGYLYIGMGDGGGSGGSGAGLSQSLTTLLGKMLRIDVDVTGPHAGACGGTGELPYGIPHDNPFADGGGCAEIAYTGLRNPWRWSFDRGRGDIFIGDVGQGAWEEVSFVAFNELNQVKNFGWKCYEGNHVYTSCPGGMDFPHTPPIIEYSRSGGNCTVVGGYRYRGPIQAMRGIYTFIDYCMGRLQLATESGGSWNVAQWGTLTGNGAVSFGEDEDGNLYLVRQSGTPLISRLTSAQTVDPQYAVWPAARAGGSISPAAPLELEAGETAAFTITPESGQVIASVEGCDGTLAGSIYTIAPVQSNCTIVARFEPIPAITHTVTPVAGPGGDIDPDVPQEVEEGETTSFVLIPDAGFLIDTVSGCGGTLVGDTYTTGPITVDCTVTASFEEEPAITYTVTPVAGAGGAIDPSVPQVVKEGTAVNFVLTPDTGFMIAGVTGCGGTLAGDTYTTAPVTANCTVSATFAEKPPGTWVVTPSAGPGGSLDPSTPQVVEHGDTISFDVIPDSGHVVQAVSGCGGTLVGLVYTTAAVTADCKVSASFAVDPADIIFVDGFELPNDR